MRLRIAAIAAGVMTVLAALTPGAFASPGGAAELAVPAGPEGGQPIFAPGGVRCTLAFNVRKGDSYYFLTAGGCAKAGLKLYADSGLTIELGTVVAVANVAVGLVRYVDPQVERPGSVQQFPGSSQDITSAEGPVVGKAICRGGSTTGTHCGTVTAVNLTVNFPEGTITGLARTNICSEPGETPGAPYFSGSTAIGIGIGAQGGCSSGGSSFFQPVVDVLSAFGVDVY